MQSFSYHDYVQDEAFMAEYRDYQQKYASSMRESDRRLIAMVLREIEAMRLTRPASVLDIGCSTGNFLLHLKNALPGLSLTGGDLVPRILDECRARPELSGITFEEMDIFHLPQTHDYDVIVANAVVHMFTNEELDRAVASITGALRPGGAYLAFDLVHPWEQELAILETSRNHPKGLLLHFRPMSIVRETMARHGFSEVAFEPFELPIDLPRPEDPGNLDTYTVRTAEGRPLAFRGALCQPWCHVAARLAKQG